MFMNIKKISHQLGYVIGHEPHNEAVATGYAYSNEPKPDQSGVRSGHYIARPPGALKKKLFIFYWLGFSN